MSAPVVVWDRCHYEWLPSGGYRLLMPLSRQDFTADFNAAADDVYRAFEQELGAHGAFSMKLVDLPDGTSEFQVTTSARALFTSNAARLRSRLEDAFAGFDRDNALEPERGAEWLQAFRG